MRLLLWWGLFTTAGVWFQSFVPGVDFLIPGIVICLQERLFVWGGWLALLWIFIQEGAGSMAFGSTLLWYGGLLGFYIGLKCYFESGNIVFILLLSALLSAWHFVLSVGLTSLQDLEVSRTALFNESLLQFIAFPAVWLSGSMLYRKYVAR
jgi:hypothetical protein